MKFSRVAKYKTLTIALAAICLLSILGRAQSGPPWWTEHEILNSGAADDYSVLNQGQLKNLAWAAYQHFETDYPGGAGDLLPLHVDNFVDLVTGIPVIGTTTDDFAAANLGQLKAMAHPFYERLVQIGYISDLPAYLDPNALVQTDTFAAANIGQAKNLFSFDLASDTDSGGAGDGLPDWWEMLHFQHLNENSTGDFDLDGLSNSDEFAQVSDPKDYYNGVTPTFTVTPAAQYSGPGLATQDFTVHVTLASADAVNAPVSLTLVSGDGQINAVPPLRTDSNGEYRFSILPAKSADTVVRVKAGNAAHQDVSAYAQLAWLLDENTGTTLAEEQGKVISGTSINGANWSTGCLGLPALTLSSAGQNYLNLGNPSGGELDFGTSSFSILLWAKIDAATETRTIVSKGSSAVSPGYYLAVDADGKIVGGVGSTTGLAADSLSFATQEEFGDGLWHHIALVVDAGVAGAAIYVDGQQQALEVAGGSDATISSEDVGLCNFSNLADLSASATSASLLVGSRGGSSEFFEGAVDDLAIMRAPATQLVVHEHRSRDTDGDGLPNWAEVAAGSSIMDPTPISDIDDDGISNWDEALAGTDPYVPDNPDGNLAVHWTFDEGSGDIIYDDSPSGAHALITSAGVRSDGFGTSSALTFGASSSTEVRAQPHPVFDFDDTVTIATWVKINVTAGRYHRIWSSAPSQPSNGFELEYNSSSAVPQNSAGGPGTEIFQRSRLTICGPLREQYIAHGVDLGTGWRHIVVVLNNVNPNRAEDPIFEPKLYVDGILLEDGVEWENAEDMDLYVDMYTNFEESSSARYKGSHSFSQSSRVDTPFVLGRHPQATGASQPLNGAIEDFRIYQRPLTQAQISKLREEGLAQFQGAPTGNIEIITGGFDMEGPPIAEYRTLEILATDDGGQPLAHQPVTFSVISGAGDLHSLNLAAGVSPGIVRTAVTDANGIAKLRLQLPATTDMVHVRARLGSHSAAPSPAAIFVDARDADSDSDYLPDVWETLLFGNINVTSTGNGQLYFPLGLQRLPRTPSTNLNSAYKFKLKIRDPGKANDDKWQVTMDVEGDAAGPVAVVTNHPNGSYPSPWEESSTLHVPSGTTASFKIKLIQKGSSGGSSFTMAIEEDENNLAAPIIRGFYGDGFGGTRYQGFTITVDDDRDGDGLVTSQEIIHGTSPSNPDSDGDGLPDGYEVDNDLDPLTDDAGEDPDGDWLTNLEEYQYDTDPNDTDSFVYKVMYSRPVDGETNVPTDKVLVVGLNKPLLSVPAEDIIELFRLSDEAPVPVTMEILADGHTVAFIPSTNLDPVTVFRLEINEEALSSVGVIPYEAVFETEALGCSRKSTIRHEYPSR